MVANAARSAFHIRLVNSEASNWRSVSCLTEHYNDSEAGSHVVLGGTDKKVRMASLSFENCGNLILTEPADFHQSM